MVAAIVVVPTFMEVLDTTIAVVALRYIAGGLSATVSDGEWVLTSYLAANAIILPISGWLSARLGRRRYFLLSIAVFTLSSALCGMASSLNQLILFRVIQGLAGGGLQPCSQGVLLDTFPPEKQGVAMTLFGLAALIAPVVGPTLGGWITDQYNWRWVFLINVPVGLLALVGCYAKLREPEYLVAQREALKKQPFQFDSIGLSLLVLVMVSWEVMLSKGQEWDWLRDPFWRVQTLAAFFVVGLVALVLWELRHRSPVVNFRPLRERNFAACCIIIFCAYLALYGASTSLPGLLQSLFGYDALSAGLVMSPGGVFALLAMPVVGLALGRGLDARWLIAGGPAGHDRRKLLDVAAQPGHQPGPGDLASRRPRRRAGDMFCARERRSLSLYPPGVAGCRRRPAEPSAKRGRQRRHVHRPRRFQERRDQFHSLRLGEYLDPFNAAAQSFIGRAQSLFQQQTADPVAAKQLALQGLEKLRQQQASALAYFDVFWLLAALTLALVVVVLFMKRSVAEKGAAIVSE